MPVPLPDRPAWSFEAELLDPNAWMPPESRPRFVPGVVVAGRSEDRQWAGMGPPDRVPDVYEEALDGASLVLEAVTPSRANYVLPDVDGDRAETLFAQVELVAAERGLMTHLGVMS